MKMLLDPHLWLRIHGEPAEANFAGVPIPGRSRERSPVSIWELVVLLERKRFTLREDMNRWVEKSKRELSLREAPVSWALAEKLTFTVPSHHDPTDRFLVATARVYDLTLVTADEQFMRVPALSVLPNR